MFAGLLDWLLWGRLPDALFVLGALVVVAAASLALRLRAHIPTAPAPEEPATPETPIATS